MSNDNSFFVGSISQQKSERIHGTFTVSHAIWLSFGVLEALIAVRIGLLLMGADPKNLVVALIYGLSRFFLLPFAGLIASPSAGSLHFEISSIFAMMIYTLVAGVVEKVTWLLLYHPVESDADEHGGQRANPHQDTGNDG